MPAHQTITNRQALEIVYDSDVRVFSLLVVAVLLGLAPSAHADAAARQRAGRAMFDLQIRVLDENKLDVFASQFIDSDKAAAVFPSSRVAAAGRKAIRTAAAGWAGTGRTPTAVTVVGTPTVGVKPDTDTGKRSERLVVVTGDLEVKAKGKRKPIALRMTSVMASGSDKANPNALAIVAVFVTEPVEDKDLRGEEVLGENTEIDRFLDMLRFPDLLAARFDAAPDDIVVGSSATDRAIGDATTKLLTRWKDLKLVVIGKPHVVKEPDWMYLMGTVSMTRGKGQKPAPINVLLVGYPECGKTCVGTEMTPHIVALHFGQPR